MHRLLTLCVLLSIPATSLAQDEALIRFKDITKSAGLYNPLAGIMGHGGAWGDFDGTGRWTFEQDGAFVNITYDWNIRAEKPLLRYLSFLMKPIFAANHRWAMAQGEACLRQELARLRP